MNSPTPRPPEGRTALLAAARAELVEHGQASISLRAVARRAGVSHAAPKYHFGDRAGLLTAVATEGFDALTTALLRTTETTGKNMLSALGVAYIDFALANPALFELMFRPGELNANDPALSDARGRAIGLLALTVEMTSHPEDASSSEVTALSLTSWALVHGLVALVRDGALQSAVDAPTPAAAAELARHLAEVFVSRAFPAHATSVLEVTTTCSPQSGGAGTQSVDDANAERRPPTGKVRRPSTG